MKYLFSLIFLFCSHFLLAQLSVGEIVKPYAFVNKQAKISKTSIDTLTIPFFDDFSTYSGSPDSTLWEQGSGAFVTLGLGIFPPSKGIISFDGLNENGNPYDFRPNFPKGTADVLSSAPIDLSPFTPTEDLSLSFFWQQAGLGEAPDARQGDSLVVEFKVPDTDTTFKWVVLWAIEASDSLPNDTIQFVQIDLTETEYFYNSFQFRIRNRGTLSGNYDNWLLDYISLNRNTFNGPRFIQDRTIQTAQQRVFRDYTSIPVEQINTDSLSNYFLDSYDYYVQTLFNDFSVYAVRNILTEDSSNSLIQNTPIQGGFINPFEIRVETGQINKNAIDAFPINKNQQYNFRKSFILFDHDDGVYESIDRRVNDTTTFEGQLGNFYAYDDGVPELGAGIRTPYGKVALEYIMYNKDTMTGLDIMFIPGERNISSTQIGIRIWSELEKDLDPIIYRQDIIGGYGEGKYSFFRVDFDSAVIVQDTIYIGWVQFDKTFLNVGYDMNNVFNDKIYTKVDPSDGWVNEADFEYPGALMIRPIFDSVSAPIAQANQLQKKETPELQEEEYEVLLAPNPAQGYVEIEGVCDAYYIYDLNGKIVSRGSKLENGDKISLSELPNGSYIIKFVNLGKLKNKRLQIFK